MHIIFSTKDTATPQLFGFFLFGAWAKSTLYTGGALSHVPRLGGRPYINWPPGGQELTSPTLQPPAPCLLFVLVRQHLREALVE